ncbi:GNAT family N-acetyltransferase [Gracilimonas sp. BCB1]|uniref:GNAT family N-acetyltransferase n=1 Tax=Gracilimonas sp. BCB1 TaxID=3152362 RepID=UPI0032D94B51
MNITIRRESKADHSDVFELIRKAFEGEEYSDQTEHFLVERLRTSDAFIPELSLVAELKGEIVGHILFTRILIKSEQQEWESLALAPVTVQPEYQGKGIGGELIKTGHEAAREAGFTSVILAGHAGYYPRFGYRPCTDFDITLPFDIPPENCMAIELEPNALNDVHGVVEYPAEFH